MKRNELIRYIIAACFLSALYTGCSESVQEETTGRSAPGVPSGITATKGIYADKVVIEWAEVPNAESYVIYKSVNSTDPGQFKVIAVKVKALIYTDTPVNPERIFYYRVAAVNGSAWSEPSGPVEGFALEGTPKPPSQLSVPTVQIGKITLIWTASVNPDISSYKILRAEKMYGDYVQIAVITDLSVLEYSDFTAVPDKKYYYRIVAVNANGDSVPSESISGIALQAVPGTPTAVAASIIYGEKINITWTAADSYAASYRIWRAPDSGDNTTPGTFELAAQNITGTMYIDKHKNPENILESLKKYYYKIQAVSSGGISAESDTAAGYRDANVPAQLDPPSSVKATKGNRDQITISWNAVEGCSGYNVYRCSTNGGTYTLIGTTTDAVITYTDNLTNTNNEKLTFFYKVSTLSTAGSNTVESMQSYYAEGYAFPFIPDVPAGITAVMNHTNKTISISWAASSRASSYNVYRADDGVDGSYNLISSQTGLTWTDTVGTAIETGAAYYYKVEAVNVGGKSSLSDPKAGKVLGTPSISGISRSLGWFKYTYTVNWTGVTGATGYQLVYDDSTTINISSGSIVTTTFDIGNLNTHNFKIRAVDTALNISGNYSAVVNK